MNEKNGILISGDFDNLKEYIPGRSTAAIKKKYLEIKGTQSIPDVFQREPQTTSKGAKWTEEEETRLVQKYSMRTENQSGARIKAILSLFPNRTEKAIATKLREKYPDIYYMRVSTSESESFRRTEPQPPADPPPLLQVTQQPVAVTSTIPAAAPPQIRTRQRKETPPEPFATTIQISDKNLVDEHLQTRIETGTGPDNNKRNVKRREERLEGPPYDEFTQDVLRKYENILKSTGRNKQKIAQFYIRPQDGRMLEATDRILEEKISEIKRTEGTEHFKRTAIKKAIYAAGRLLSREIGKREITGKIPLYKITDRKIKKFMKHLENAKKIQKTRGKLNRPLLREMEIIKKLKMSVKQYISSTEERLKLLKEQLKQQKNRHEKQKLRSRFWKTPSMKILGKPTGDVRIPNVTKIETYYTNIYKKESCEQPTPIFNGWLSKLKKYSNTIDTSDQTDTGELKKKITNILKRTAPWKAPGEDGIPAYLYKILMSAQEYLVESTIAYLQGRKDLTQVDTRATITLIYKKGDEEDPANYRPIAVLNADYKILTAVMTKIIKQRLPEWAIPPEQLARENIWGTVHGFLLDKSFTQVARMRRTKHYSAWYDLSKAYDSIHHRDLKRLIDCLPINPAIRRLFKNAMKKWTIRIKAGKNITKEIPVQRGLFQGDPASPLLFILATGGLLSHVRSDKKINRSSRGKHQLIAFMDDFKCHTPNKKSLELITKELEEGASEIGLRLNKAKCGYYTRGMESQDDNDSSPFLPEIREGYKYLGLHQLERDTIDNYDDIQIKIEEKVREIAESDLTTMQKITLINTSVNPAATYVLGNIFTDEKRATTLKKSRDIDAKIRKILVEQNIKGKTQSNARLYLSTQKGGLGLRPLELEVELQFVRKGVYLQKHEEMKEALIAYQALKNAGWRNPISDFEYILEKYEIEVDLSEESDTPKLTKDLIKRIEERHQAEIEKEWSSNLSYAKNVLKEPNIRFPANSSPNMDSWRLGVLLSASEEQIHGLGANPNNRRKCQLGCGLDENSYHVACACPSRAATTRHDFIVHWVLKILLQGLGAPDELRRELQFGKASLNCDIGKIKIQAGNKILTGKKIYHNKPDIMVRTTDPDKIYLIEVAVSHIQNLRQQEELKRTRYAVNSTKKLDFSNYREAQRDLNLVTELENLYKCPVKLGVYVVGCFGELVLTQEHKNFCSILEEIDLGKEEIKKVHNKCSYSVAVSTTNMILRRIRDGMGGMGQDTNII
ncbi:uncharacterized protein LOC123310835 [Coccinella septempunctata]|uniref:uncharacterized protein LOC123310835 n=1 Tax=Coccinella septempunctata TaxID=41139 RepID=UPI001D075AFC|nr:uncharacterized protein LOC123310835 [Coccinella septempunctata]